MTTRSTVIVKWKHTDKTPVFSAFLLSFSTKRWKLYLTVCPKEEEVKQGRGEKFAYWACWESTVFNGRIRGETGCNAHETSRLQNHTFPNSRKPVGKFFLLDWKDYIKDIYSRKLEESCTDNRLKEKPSQWSQTNCIFLIGKRNYFIVIINCYFKKKFVKSVF